MEAMINELFIDTGHAEARGGYLAPLSQQTLDELDSLWRGTKDAQKASPLERYKSFLVTAGRPTTLGVQPFQDAKLVSLLRNALAHYEQETLASEGTPGTDADFLEKLLRTKFDSSSLLRGSGNPWWPDHCLGVGCARWAARSVRAVADHLASELKIQPHYQRLRSFWTTQPPGVLGTP